MRSYFHLSDYETDQIGVLYQVSLITTDRASLSFRWR
jgi:hypothetical protein